MNSSEDEKVSIVIPVYNSEKYLAECLDSLVSQTLENIEIICVNNGSVDESLHILQEYAQKDARLKVFDIENNGPGAARNFGITQACGEYIGFCDSDDWVDLDFYEKLYGAAKKYDADLACASMQRVRKHHSKFRIKIEKEAVFTDIQEKLDVCNIPKMCYTPNKIYKRTSLINSGVKFREGCFFEDVDYMFKVAYFLPKLVTVPSVCYYYRVNPCSIVKTHNEEKEKNKEYAYSEIRKFAKKYDIKLKESDKIVSRKLINFLGITILKIKIWENYKKYYLFGFLKIAKVKQN